MSDFHVFISYARKDNQPDSAGRPGWVTAFVERLKTQHLNYAGKPLRVFFDTDEIGPDADWQARIARGLRTSRLFIAFLSPNYLESRVCRWEFEEYLRLEHTLARGDEGVKQIHFVSIDGLYTQPAESFGADKAEMVRELQRRNLSGQQRFELIDWYKEGTDLLMELDAEERLAALRDNPRSDRDRRIISLADQMHAIDRAIAQRLDQAALADISPGNIAASYANFVGRARELRDLHKALVQDRIGLVGALHGLGGQGKTALAVQYAYAYAGHYAAGGRWLLECEGKAHLADALEPLAGLMRFQLPDRDPNRSEPENRSLRLQHILAALRQRVEAGAAALPEALARHSDLHSRANDRPDLQTHMLLILDNVDQPELLSASEAAGVAGQDWLQVVMTTRLDPGRFGAADQRLSVIPVDDLPPDDALALLRRMRPFADAGEESSARDIVQLLGGFTLGVELVGAFLAGRPEITYAAYHARLVGEGIAGADALAEDAGTADRIRHRDKQIGRILDDTLAALPESAREILACAALFPADQIVIDWLRYVASQRDPGLSSEQVKPGYPDPFSDMMRDLSGRRLLPPSVIRNPFREDLAAVRLHRLVAAHLDSQATRAEKAERRDAAEAVLGGLGAAVEQAFSGAPQAVAWAIEPLAMWAERLHSEQPTAETARALGALSIPVSRFGVLDRGLQLASAAVAAHQRLLEANPDDAQAARDLSVSLTRLGDLVLRRGQNGDAERALKAYEGSLAIDQRLLEANPDNAEAARDLSVSLNKLGDFFLRRGQSGDADRALKAYEACQATLQRLFEANPDDAQAARDLSVSLNKLGDFFLRRGQSGDAERALKAYEGSLAIDQRLLEANPNDAQAARDLSISLSKQGDFFLRRGQSGDADRALKAYEACQATLQRLLEANPDDAQAARDLSVSLSRLGDFFLRRDQSGDAERALKAYEGGLAIDQRLLEANPNDAQAARDLSVSYERLARMRLREGPGFDPKQGRAMIDRALGLRAGLAAAIPGSEDLRREAIVTLSQLPRACAAAGDDAAAQAAFEQLRQWVSDYLAAGFETHPQIANLAARLGLSGGAMQRPEITEEAIDAVLADPDNRRQLDEALKADGVEGGLAALDADQQRAIVRQVLQRSGDGAPTSEEDQSSAGVQTDEPPA